jgi:hypothetical protein
MRAEYLSSNHTLRLRIAGGHRLALTRWCVSTLRPVDALIPYKHFCLDGRYHHSRK